MTLSTGTILLSGNTSTPSGFLLCDGSAVSRTTYATLFGVIGTTYGAGDGSTTFNLPDLSGGVSPPPAVTLSYYIATQDIVDGTVDSVGLSTNAGWFTVSGSPVTNSGTLAMNLTTGLTANQFLATPNGSAGTVGLRALSGADMPSNSKISSVGTVVDGGGFVLTTGQKGYIYCPFAGTITAATMIADSVGSIVMDVWKTPFNTIPTVANTITAGSPPTLSGAQTSQNTTLSGWTTSVSAGDVFGFNINSVSGIHRIMLELTIVRS